MRKGLLGLALLIFFYKTILTSGSFYLARLYYLLSILFESTVMDNLFKIIFDFSLDGSSRVIQLEAMVALHYSTPHYKVNKINRKGQNSPSDLLPEVDIKCIVSDDGYKWVHTDSGKETYLSKAIGSAIEKTQGRPKIADENNDPDEEI